MCKLAGARFFICTFALLLTVPCSLKTVSLPLISISNMTTEHTYSEQETLRRQSLAELTNRGITAYPSPTWPITHTAQGILENYKSGDTGYENISIAGRLMSQRIMGKASFASLMDSTGRIQLYLNRDEICPGEDKSLYNDVFKKLMDLGDIIGVTGYAFVTQTGEISIHVKELKLLSKSLRPLPVVKEKDGVTYDAFSDPELRYRQRYVDLIVNNHVKDIFIKRTKLINSMRNFLADKGYLEVETPILQPLYGGAAARPFTTHHNTLDMTLYLRNADELYLKRLILV